MSTAAVLETKNVCVKEALVAMTEPKNKILSRLQSKFTTKEDRVMFGYSRMHNRHNRS